MIIARSANVATCNSEFLRLLTGKSVVPYLLVVSGTNAEVISVSLTDKSVPDCMKRSVPKYPADLGNSATAVMMPTGI